MKTVLFVPGSGEDLHSRDYSATIRAIENKGYKVKFIDITWPRTTIDVWVEELDTVYAKYDAKNTILAGFSWGAMTAFLSATRRNPSELWLFSLSPYFAEDIQSKNQKKSWLTQIGHRRVTAFSKLHFEALSKSIHCKTLCFFGQKEIDKWAVMKERADGTKKFLKNNTTIVIKGIGHDVADPIYIAAITEVI